MKLNISPKDCVYMVYPDKKKVVCIINNTEYLFLNFVYSNFNIMVQDIGDSDFYITNHKFSKKFHMPKRFVGVATCSEDDQWDEEIGKLIAYSRAKDNLNKSFFKRANLYVNSIDKEVEKATETLSLLGYKLTLNTQHRHERIASILGEK